MGAGKEELIWAGAARLGELLHAREVSSRALVELFLARIDALDPQLNAFRAVRHARALAAADAAQARIDAGEDGPLLGVPIAIKDNVPEEGEVTANGTLPLGAPASADADLVARLKGAGMVPIGRTNLPELAILPVTESGTWGYTRNPWRLDRTPGGSSGGSAAAVAAGMVPLATASDGGGSIRIPAACCGLFGLKPQRRRVSLGGGGAAQEHWHGLSSAGCVSRTVRDTALFLDVVADAGHPSYADATAAPPGRLRIGISTRPIQFAPVHADVRAAVERTAEALRGLGHAVGEASPSYGVQLGGFLPRYLRGIADDAQGLPRPDLLDARTRGFVKLGRRITPGMVRRARAAEPKFAERLSALWDAWDILVTPVLARPPARVGWLDGKGAVLTLDVLSRYAAFTTPWNLVGWPAASVPAGLSSEGTPIGVQLVAPPDGEPRLLSLAAQLEHAQNWAARRPPNIPG